MAAATVRCFMDRVMARTDDGLIVESAKFVYKLANQLEGDRLGVWVTAKNVAAHYGPEVGFVRVVIALSQMTRIPFGFENAGCWRYRPLIQLVDYDLTARTMHIFFSRECRDMLQDVTSAWRLHIQPGIERPGR
jgi:hypothetical protein